MNSTAYFGKLDCFRDNVLNDYLRLISIRKGYGLFIIRRIDCNLRAFGNGFKDLNDLHNQCRQFYFCKIC